MIVIKFPLFEDCFVVQFLEQIKSLVVKQTVGSSVPVCISKIWEALFWDTTKNYPNIIKAIEAWMIIIEQTDFTSWNLVKNNGVGAE